MKRKQHLLVTLVIVLIIVNFVATTVMSVWVVYSTVKENEVEMVKSFTQNVYEAIRKELQEPITVGRAVVNTETLIDLLEREDEYTKDELAEIFKTYLKNYKEFFDYNSISIVSNKTGNYYTQFGFNKTIDPENDEHDIWYKSFIDTGKEYDFDIDVDEVYGNTWTMFMNIRIVDHDGNLLGVSGLGIDLSYLQDIISDLESQYGISITFVDQFGNVQLSRDDANITNRVLSATALKTNNYFTSTKLFNEKYTVSKQLNELGWIIQVEKENKLNEYTINIVKNNLIFMAILVVIVIAIVTISINRNQNKLIKESEDAQKASVAKGQFLANMSHEIRTPINGILGMDEMLLKVCTDEQQIEYAKNIQSAGKTLLSLINDILDVSKIESGKMEIINVDYDLFSIFNDCYNINVYRVRNKGLDFNMEIDPKIPAILHGDEVRIRQVINNLLSNAAKYTSEGKVSLIANYEDIDDCNILLKIKVSDTGIGIKPEDMEQLFESFTRLDEEKNRNIEGTGLGLNLCQNLVQLMGGTIKVESKYGVGSTFTINIPQRIVSSEPIGDFGEKYQEYAKNNEHKGIKLNAPDASILIVDDVEMNIMVAAGLLEDTGIKIDTATSGDECIDKMLKNDYDVVFLDHMMPGMDGMETLMKWSAIEKTRNTNTPVIMLTANAISGAREQYLSAGFVDYLTKPISENDLIDMLIKYIPEHKVLLVEQSVDVNTVIDMNEWCCELDTRYSQLTDNERLKIKVVVDSNLPQLVEGNKEALDLILDNLVLESVSHTKEGKIIVSIQKSEKSEDEILTVEYSVRDSGDRYNTASKYVLVAKEELVKLGSGLYISSITDLGASVSFLYKQVAKSEAKIEEISYEETSDDIQVVDNTLRIEGINIVKGMEIVLGNEKLYFEILREFVKGADKFTASMNAAIFEKDWKQYRIDAHSIKSEAYSIGATELGDLAKTLEYAARDENEEFIKENHAYIVETLNTIAQNARKLLTEKGVQVELVFESELDMLIAAIDDFDKEKSLDLLDNVSGDEVIINNIRQALEEYNYFDARDYAEQLR